MSYVLTEVDGFVATLTINRPEALNALNRAVLADLDQAERAIAASSARCVILTGAGEKAFVAGADIAEMAALTRDEAAEFSRLGSAVFRRLETLPVPVIAAVNGFALGGGCELALACDLRVASTRAAFAQPEVGLGIPAGFGATQRLPRLVGVGVAKDLLYTGRRIGAAEAAAIGLVSAVVEPEQLMDKAREWAATIARQAPAAIRATKSAIGQGGAVDIDQGLALETAAFAGCFETADQREAMTAFVERRPAAPFRDQ